MNKNEVIESYAAALVGIEAGGMLKRERVIATPQGARIRADGRELLVMCANNYLGLANNPEIIEAARESYAQWGYGMSSVRFICGTQEIHKKLEVAVAAFVGQEDAILYSSCFDANGGVFETLLTEADAVISDELNHASIIDGVRLCKAKRFRYKNNDMADLETQLVAADDAGARVKLIVTDGVFSMDGTIANLRGVCDIAEKHGALVMVDDSHATGFVGATGRGSCEHCGVTGRVDIVTSTFGKALGGASGGFTAARREIVALLRQRSRPYLFSNTLAPAIAAGTLKALEILQRGSQLRDRLESLTAYYRTKLKTAGFDIIDGTHPIVPIMFYDERKASAVAQKLYELGVYAVGFTYPVVPKGRARIRTQVSAAHTESDLDFAVECFVKATT
ncbi:MAG: glycine C-acetyltransferase [Kiritimatiellaeota bacterium]|nr:glycine C-acetyltransferase [Kiritimatiellota bacterium]